MRALARFLLILPLVVWIGSVIFFSFVVAPAAFSLLPTQELAARIVGNSLRTLHYIGLVCGTILLLATLLVDLKRATAVRAAMGLMLLCTAISQFGITPQMQRIRATVGGSIQALPPQDAGRAAFDRLHQFSIILEGVVLLAGLGVVGLIAAEEKS